MARDGLLIIAQYNHSFTLILMKLLGLLPIKDSKYLNHDLRSGVWTENREGKETRKKMEGLTEGK